MSEPESVVQRSWSWPADYYSGPSPRAVLPKGVTFGCGAASIVALLVALAPVTPPAIAWAAVAAGLAALTWSFAVDIAWLAANPSDA